MASEIKDLKVIVFEKWSSDHSSGNELQYYCDWSDKYEDLYCVISGATEDILDCIDGDDKKELLELVNNKAATYEYMREFFFDNGRFSLECILVAEGEDIVEAITKLIYNVLEDYFLDDDDDIHSDVKEVIETAKNDPHDFDSVISLLETFNDSIRIGKRF